MNKHILRFRTTPFIGILFACIVFWAGCSDDENPVDYDYKGPDVILPLGVGWFWDGNVTLRDSLGNVMSTGHQVYGVSSDTTIGSDTWYYIQDSGVLYANLSDGLWARFGYSDSLELKAPIIFAEWPTTVGTLYQTGYDESDTVEVLSVDTTITVPRGSYVCHEYMRTKPNDNRRLYYFLAPRYGWVKIEIYKPDLSGDYYLYFSWELTSYDLNDLN
jgi:hypothetical protein